MRLSIAALSLAAFVALVSGSAVPRGAFSQPFTTTFASGSTNADIESTTIPTLTDTHFIARATAAVF